MGPRAQTRSAGTRVDVLRSALAGPAERVAALDWPRIYTELDLRGFATTGPLLAADDCADLVQQYEAEDRYRNRVVMARHGYGSGEYRYFAYPLPGVVAALREAAYAPLVATANAWATALRQPATFPPVLAEMLERCHAAEQRRPTPLLLKYGPGDYNALHQDLYGERVFPIQLAVVLDEPGTDFEGGEFVLVEQRPRMQSRAHVVPLRRGEGVFFAVRERPVQGTRGIYRTMMRHGVATVRAGARHTLGVIFHDAA